MSERYKDRSDHGLYEALPLLQAIRADQIKGREEHKGQYQRLSNILGEQNTAINRLSTDVASLSLKTANLEFEQRKHADTLARVKEAQDGCAARITHRDDSTEIRSLRDQLHKAVIRRMTPAGGVPRHRAGQDAAGSWWQTPAGKAVLGALAGLLVALTSALTTYFTIVRDKPTEKPPAAVQEKTGDRFDVGGETDSDFLP